MGRIGTAVARQAHHGFGMRIIYSGRSPLSDSVAVELGAEFLTLNELLARADFVSLHCPATPETLNLIDAQALAGMRKEAILINTARGDVVVESDLIQAVKNSVIAGAGLEAYTREPSVPTELQAMEQVVLLPHMGSGTRETRQAMGRSAKANLQAHFAKQPLPNAIG